MVKGKCKKIVGSKKVVVAAMALMLSACALPFMNPAVKSDAADPLIDGEWYYEINADNTVKTLKYTGVGDASGTVVVPATIAGRTVTVIGGKTGCSYEGTFRNKEMITNVVIPKSVKTIEKAAFEGCKDLKAVSGLDNVTTIGDSAFRECAQLSSIALGVGGTIGAEAFEKCGLLGAVAFGPETTSIGDGAFRDCKMLAAVNIPGKVQTIGAEAFMNCDYVSSVVIPASVTEMGKGAFAECDSLSNVANNSQITVLARGTFRDCKSLTTATISNAVRTIEESAFLGDDKLLEITIPSSVRTIGPSAFEGCSALAKVNMNFGLLKIEGSAFKDDFALSSVVIPNSTTTIERDVFEGCSGIKTMLLPNSITSIGGGVFDGCTPEFQVYQGSYAQKFLEENGYVYTLLPSVAASSLEFTNNTVYMVGGDTIALKYVIAPENTTDAIVWTSSYPGIAEVNQVGEVTAGDKGIATIIATTTSGINPRVKVVVSNPVKSISFDINSKTMYVGDKFNKAAVVKDKDGVRTDIKPNYTSSNNAIASVDALTGTVVAKSPGVVNITAATGKLSASYKLTVVKKPAVSNSSNKKLKTISKKSVSKKGKVLTVKTLRGAKVTVTAKKSILGKASKSVKADKKGVAKIKFKKKIKKVTVTVKIKKSGYKTFKKNYKY